MASEDSGIGFIAVVLGIRLVGGDLGFYSTWNDELEKLVMPREREELEKHLTRASKVIGGVLVRALELPLMRND